MTRTVDDTRLRRWLPFGMSDGDVRLYCLPHAGGSASAYRPWFGRLGPVAVCPVQPPGRETRLREEPFTGVEALVGELAEVVLTEDDRPWAVYGHSLGAVVGFELVREIRRRGGPDPVHLFVSASPAPATPDTDPQVTGLDDEQVVAMLRRLGGTPDWMLADPSVRRMILPPFRGDFALKENYRYRPEPPLRVPITAIAASHDPRASAVSMHGWREETTGRFRAHSIGGGHFAVLEQPSVTHRYIGAALGVLAGAGPVGGTP
ncbi:thioesterase II family protein [Micromonospora sp. AMSO12t]|uniref:thioesterase II family protein n=1 Tax=Micromonospora sp. AMSO12t TaxID=2650410 RepID=UPI001CEC3A8C|nr:thioesterase domain-containing protein [Micromonospora sp. AMSO12t]